MPFQWLGGNLFGGFGTGGFDGPMPKRQKEDATIGKMPLPVTLEDLCKGCTKKLQITKYSNLVKLNYICELLKKHYRKITNSDGTSRTEDKVLTINIKPGWKDGTTITFPEEGDIYPDRVPADIAFIIKDKPHPTFTRDGSNIR
jgi:DnaJ-class molecular chaperone